jgi:glycosyltransferase involved in cell wall biosynthesis
MKSSGNPPSSESFTSQKDQTAGPGTQGTASVGDGDDAPEKITVLLSKHPCSANLFAAGEIRCLRRLGYDIALSALESTLDVGADLNHEIRAETEATYYLRARGRLRELANHLRAATRPLSYLTVVYWAIRLDGWLSLVKNRHVADVLTLDRWMRRHGIRHLHAHFGSEAGRVAVLMRHFRPVTVSLTLGNADDLHYAGIIRLQQKVEAADFIICVGIAARTALMRFTPHRYWHKYDAYAPGVDTLRFQPRPSRLKPGTFTVLCVGPLEPHNGQRTLLEACKILRESGREIRLVLVGAGSDETALKSQAKASDLEQTVTFTGALHQDRLCDWYSRADAFVNSSLSADMSLPAMEAMASGLACVSARTTGMLELIREGSDGLLVEPASAHELAGALLRLMDDEDLRKHLAGHGRARILQKYSLARTSERFGFLFQTRLSSRHGRRRTAVASDAYRMKSGPSSDPVD